MIDWTPHDLAGRLVLVVDDDSRVRAYIRRILENVGVGVLEAADGLEALEVFRACHSDIELVITDIRMPRMTGTDLAISLRSLLPAIPLVFVSGDPAPADMHDPGRRLVFVEKPFAPKTLLEAAASVLPAIPAAS